MPVAASIEEGRERIAELVAAFKKNENDHLAAGYNETQARTDFISPMLEAFGWDVHNEQGHPIGLREVFEEATVEVGEEGLSKKPDYELRLARQRKLFVEAKKPRVDINTTSSAAFQTRRYGFSASLPISILTNFRQLAIYDCRPLPDEGHDARFARLLTVDCNEYVARFDELWGLFSREAVYSGQFDVRFEVGATRIGAEQFDDLFLGQVRNWRSRLAAEVHTNHPEFTPTELTYVVQLMLSRIVFLRICEDRDIEAYESLRNLAAPGTYEAFQATLQSADDFYNSGLFRLIANDPLAVRVSDEVMQSILAELYYPQSPYTFAVVEPEVLGEIYEQFLGEEITFDGGTIQVTYKPEVREAGGVVPTPRYVVDKIVDRTIGPRLDGRSPQELEGFTVADLCCGSGIFLLSAYELLLEHHLSWYLANDRAQHVGSRIFEVAGGHWRLSFAERRRILLAHLRGVDIDANAVEIGRLSLLLKLIEDETRADLEDFVRQTGQRALPELEGVLKHGNSLVQHGAWEAFGHAGAQPATLNPFTWAHEFPADFARGGFGAIVGNPPYTRIQTMRHYFPDELRFYQSAASTFASPSGGNFDKYYLFVERSFQLTQADGRIGIIIPHKFMSTTAGRPLRHLLSSGDVLEEVVHFGAQMVFNDLANYTCILIADRQGGPDIELERVSNLERWRYGDGGVRSTLVADRLTDEPWEIANPEAMLIFERMRDIHPMRLGTAAEIFVGLQTSADGVYAIKPTRETADHFIVSYGGQEWPIEKAIVRPGILDSQLTAYRRPVPDCWFIFPYEAAANGANRLIAPEAMAARFPACLAYLEARRAELDPDRPVVDGRRPRNVMGGPVAERQWYQYGRSQSLDKISDPKVVIRVLSREPKHAFDDAETMFTGGGNGPYYGLRPAVGSAFSLRYLLAVLCHPLTEALIRSRTSVFRGGYYSHGKQFLAPLPVPDPGQLERERIDGLVAELVEAYSEVDLIRLPAQRAQRERDIIRLKERIEESITAAFALTPDELATARAVPIPD